MNNNNKKSILVSHDLCCYISSKKLSWFIFADFTESVSTLKNQSFQLCKMTNQSFVCQRYEVFSIFCEFRRFIVKNESAESAEIFKC